MKPRAYVETSVVSYLTAGPSRDLVRTTHQQITREWWQDRGRFDLYISPLVLREAGGGTAEASRARLEALAGIPVLAVVPGANALARQFIRHGPLPPKAGSDALHIALAVVHGMDFLLTWNCSHIANAAMRRQIEAVCRQNGFEPPVLCTPEELLEERR